MFLYLDFGEEQFAYIIGDRLYFPFDLTPLDESIRDLREGGDFIPLEILQQAQSQLVTVATDVGYLLVASPAPGNYQVLYSSAPLEEMLGQKVIDVESLPILIPDRTLPPFDPTSFITLRNAIDRQTVEQLFGTDFPATPTRVIDFPDAKEKLDEGWIVNWRPEPQLQAWTRPPNSMLSLFDQDGSRYLVSARLDPATSQIYPPV